MTPGRSADRTWIDSPRHATLLPAKLAPPCEQQIGIEIVAPRDHRYQGAWRLGLGDDLPLLLLAPAPAGARAPSSEIGSTSRQRHLRLCRLSLHLSSG